MTTTDQVNTALHQKAAAKAHEEMLLMNNKVQEAVSIQTCSDAKKPSCITGKYQSIDADAYKHNYHHGEESMKRYQEFVRAFNAFTSTWAKERTAFLHNQMVKDLLEKVTLLG